MATDDKWKGKNLSYMTPGMMHALKMSQMQSQVRSLIWIFSKNLIFNRMQSYVQYYCVQDKLCFRVVGMNGSIHGINFSDVK